MFKLTFFFCFTWNLHTADCILRQKTKWTCLMRRNVEQMPQLLRGTNSSFRSWRLCSLLLFQVLVLVLTIYSLPPPPLTHLIQGDTLTPRLITINFNIILPSCMSLWNDFLLTVFLAKILCTFLISHTYVLFYLITQKHVFFFFFFFINFFFFFFFFF
jgi:hypothetical protein